MKRLAIIDDYCNVVLSLPYWERLQGRVKIDVFQDTVTDEPAFARRLEPYAIVVPIRERSQFPASLLTQLPELELLALTGHNSGHVDVGAATSRGILVAETDGSGASAYELTVGLVLALVRSIPAEDRAMREGRWQTTMGMELAGNTLGILGLGRIGRRMAAFGRLMNMRVLAAGPTLTDERAAAAGVTRVTVEELFQQSDVLSVHLRLVDQTRGFVTARLLSTMKPTAYLVNTARGPLVDEAALINALRERRIAGAALDVYDTEPLPRDHPFRSLDNVVLAPHIGYVTREAYHLFFSQAVENIERYLNGEMPPRALNPEAMAQRTAR